MHHVTICAKCDRSIGRVSGESIETVLKAIRFRKRRQGKNPDSLNKRYDFDGPVAANQQV
jgi:hypothetical protein